MMIIKLVMQVSNERLRVRKWGRKRKGRTVVWKEEGAEDEGGGGAVVVAGGKAVEEPETVMANLCPLLQ